LPREIGSHCTETTWTSVDIVNEGRKSSERLEDQSSSAAQVAASMLPAGKAMASPETVKPELSFTERRYYTPEPVKRLNPITRSIIEGIDINSELPNYQRQQVRQLLHQFKDIFAEGLEDVAIARVEPHRIDTGTSRPIRQRPRPTSALNKKITRDKVDQLLKAGIIKPCKGPWASPIVIVHKEGSKPRFCVDYRKLNDVTKKDAYPLPHIDDILDSMGPAKIFSTIDAASGYHQILVHPEDQEKTCYTTWQGNFQ